MGECVLETLLPAQLLAGAEEKLSSGHRILARTLLLLTRLFGSPAFDRGEQSQVQENN